MEPILRNTLALLALGLGAAGLFMTLSSFGEQSFQVDPWVGVGVVVFAGWLLMMSMTERPSGYYGKRYNTAERVDEGGTSERAASRRLRFATPRVI